MEYGRLEPIKGVNGQEPTAFTKKTIKELLAEEAEAAEARAQDGQAEVAHPPAADEITQVAQDILEVPVAPERVEPAGLQQPPHMRDDRFEPLVEEEEYDVRVVEKPVQRRPSLLRRLIGG